MKEGEWIYVISYSVSVLLIMLLIPFAEGETVAVFIKEEPREASPGDREFFINRLL